MRWFILISIITSLVNSTDVSAKNLSDYSIYEFDVRFTNPVCKTYSYNDSLLSNSGTNIKTKPQNAFCTTADVNNSNKRSESVYTKLVTWIKSSDTKEIFFSSLSFSNSDVRKELCLAAERGVKIRFVLDNNTDTSEADLLTRCGKITPEYELRGGGSGTGYSHNKFFIFNPSQKGEIRIIFASGNVSSGTALHHESWNFLKTHTDSHLAQKQLCLMDALWETRDSSKTSFRSNFLSCTSKIKTRPEEDIRLYVIPLEGTAATSSLSRALPYSKRAWVTAHRFSWNSLMGGLSSRLSKKRSVRFIGDDDLYWADRENFTDNRNTRYEWNNVNRLMNQGMQARFLETNHWGYIYQHNRMIVLDKDLFTGSANWTNAGLSRNFESFYHIKIPSVIEKYANQFNHLWSLSTEMGNLPRRNVEPR